MRHYIAWLFWGLLLLSWVTNAQSGNSLSPGNDATEYSLTDSLSIIALIDSLLAMEETSQLGVRLNYNSNILSAGRTLGIQKFGISPGVTYYHKSGAFADVSGFWTNDFIPKYYLTTFTAGYSHIFTKRFSTIVSYDHFFYRSIYSDAYIPFSNTLTISPFFDTKYISFRFDYSYYFGETDAHRFTPGVMFNLEKKNYRKLKRIAFTPAFYMLLGNVNITVIKQLYDDRETARRELLGLPTMSITSKEVWGVLNYAFTLPVFVSFKKWSLSAGYTYTIPRKVSDDEPLSLEKTGFLTASFIYYINLKPRKGL